jgi:hypothetical protein
MLGVGVGAHIAVGPVVLVGPVVGLPATRQRLVAQIPAAAVAVAKVHKVTVVQV